MTATLFEVLVQEGLEVHVVALLVQELVHVDGRVVLQMTSRRTLGLTCLLFLRLHGLFVLFIDFVDFGGGVFLGGFSGLAVGVTLGIDVV